MDNEKNNYNSEDNNENESFTTYGSNDHDNNTTDVNNDNGSSNTARSGSSDDYSAGGNRGNDYGGRYDGGYNNRGNSNGDNGSYNNYRSNNDYNNGRYGNSNYNNGNYNYNNNNYNNGNNNNKWKKTAAIIGAVAAFMVMMVMVSSVIEVVMKNASGRGQENVVWNDEVKDDDKKDDNDADKKEADDAEDSSAIATTAPVTVSQSTAQAGAAMDVSDIVENVMPSVVSIISTTSVKGYSIFGQQYEQEVSSGGSGFIIGENDSELLLATNNHVVEDATAIQITFVDETTAEAVVKGADPDADLAVVAVKLSDIDSDTKDKIKVAVLGDSDNVKVGQLAIAIGNAKGMGQSVTVGYISAKNRELDIPNEKTGKIMKMNYLQTDAAINGGNSGGPLLDASGNVVGISSAKISDTRIEGMCYAIPISNAIPIINELMNRETISEDEKGYMGVRLSNVSSEAVKMYGVPEGAYVADVYKDSPAEQAGIKQGDIIVKIGDAEVKSSSSATDKIRSNKAGATITVTLYRQSAGSNGYEEMKLDVELTTADALSKKEDVNEDDEDDSGYDPYDDMFRDFPW